MSDKRPLISFVITYYNLPVPHLKECIGSILALSLSSKEREIVLVDDGSEHCILDALGDMKDEIIYIRQKNGGLSSARNRGIDCSTGHYIQFVDADDYLVTNAYEQCVDVVRYNKEVEMVMFDYTTNPIKDQQLSNHIEEDTGTSFLLHNNLHASACSYLFKRTTLGSLRFTRDIYHEDEDFTPQLVIRTEKIVSTKLKAYFYRERQGSIMQKKDPKHIIKRLDDTEYVILHLNRILQNMPQHDRLAMQRRVHQLTMDYIFNIIRLTHSERQLNKRLRRLEQHSLFPLPHKKYTEKYFLFSFLSKYRISRKLLNLFIKTVS